MRLGALGGCPPPTDASEAAQGNQSAEPQGQTGRQGHRAGAERLDRSGAVCADKTARDDLACGAVRDLRACQREERVGLQRRHHPRRRLLSRRAVKLEQSEGTIEAHSTDQDTLGLISLVSLCSSDSASI